MSVGTFNALQSKTTRNTPGLGQVGFITCYHKAGNANHEECWGISVTEGWKGHLGFGLVLNNLGEGFCSTGEHQDLTVSARPAPGYQGQLLFFSEPEPRSRVVWLETFPMLLPVHSNLKRRQAEEEFHL